MYSKRIYARQRKPADVRRKLAPPFIQLPSEFFHFHFEFRNKKEIFRQITLSYVVSYAATNDLTWRMLVHTTDIEMAGHLCVFCYVSSVHHFVWISSRNPLLCKCMAFLPYVSFGVLSYGLIWCMSWHNHLVDIDELFAYALMFFFFVIWQLYLL